MRKRTLFLAGAAAIFVSSGVSVTLTPSTGSGAPFIDPALIARSMCGSDGAGLATRRAFFIRAATAYAAQAVPDEATATRPARAELSPPGIAYDADTDSVEAQTAFNAGLAHMFNFNHAEAVTAFTRAQEADPDCALCYWGTAIALGPNINAPMADEDLPVARAALETALALSEGADDRFRGLIEALATRYPDEPDADRSPYDIAYAETMDRLVATYPDDLFIATLAAEANMDTPAWDYWLAGGRTPKGRTARTLSLLEGVLARDPDYIPAIHLYIHITEASSDPYRALPYADRLAGLAPGYGHLVHMPSHSYYRVGQYGKALDHNIEAVAADETYLASADASTLYEYGYFTHNLHFGLVSAQAGGDAQTALAMAEKLDAKLPLDMSEVVVWVQPIKAAPYFAKAQFADVDLAMGQPQPADTMPYLKAAWHYSRGEALARAGRTDEAMAEADAIAQLAATADLSSLEANGVPASAVFSISRLTVIARAAMAQGDYPTAIEAMEEAAALQAEMAYMEPPYWYYPASQTLAAALLLDGQTERAEQLFIETLVASPNNAYALLGLMKVYEARKETDAARYARTLFDKYWLGETDSLPELTSL